MTPLQAYPRRAAMVSVLVGIALVVAASVYAFRSSIAVALAPGKTADARRSELAIRADTMFWDAFHAGRYDDIPVVLDALTAAYLQNPRDAQTAAHIAFSHVWALNELARRDARSASATDGIVLSRKYFAEASRLAPADERYKGFLAGMELAEGSVHADEQLSRRGYFDLMKAIDGWPEFNLFTAGYVLSRLPYTDEKYAQAVAYQWRNLDACAGERVDRGTARYDQYMTKETTTGVKRACWNSWIAPHNFEGFFLNMGDMLVKQGDPARARRVYANARLSKSYATWPFKTVLDDRIANADRNVELFRMAVRGEQTRTIMIMSTFACVACHQR